MTSKTPNEGHVNHLLIGAEFLAGLDVIYTTHTESSSI